MLFTNPELSSYAHGDRGGVCRSVTLSVCFKRSYGVCFTCMIILEGPRTPISFDKATGISEAFLCEFLQNISLINSFQCESHMQSPTRPDVLLLWFYACVYMDTKWPRHSIYA